MNSLDKQVKLLDIHNMKNNLKESRDRLLFHVTRKSKLYEEGTSWCLDEYLEQHEKEILQWYDNELKILNTMEKVIKNENGY